MDDSARTSAGSGRGGVCCLRSFQEVPSHRWSTAAECHDVALTADGRALLAAAGEMGLLEFAATSGAVLSRWKPPEASDEAEHSSGGRHRSSVSVCSVGALRDGRAAAAVSYPRFVDILRRDHPEGSSDGCGDNRWVCERRIAGFQASIGLLVVHDDVLAVAEYAIVCDPNDPTRTQRLPRFALIALNSGELRLRQRTDYAIGSLAIAEHSVVVASSNSLLPLTEPPSPTESGKEKCWLMDSYSHAGERTWRRSWKEAVADVVPSAICEPAVLYVALAGGSCVVAVSQTDGLLLCSVLSACGTPRSISYCASENDDVFLAVLHTDRKTVAVHWAISEDDLECPLR